MAQYSELSHVNFNAIGSINWATFLIEFSGFATGIGMLSQVGEESLQIGNLDITQNCNFDI